MWLFYYFDFDRKYEVLKLKSLFKNEMEPKIENTTHLFRERRTFCFSSHKNRELKVKP